VTPPGFLGLIVGDRFDIVLPFCEPKQLMRNLFEVTVMGRLRPGISLAGASAELAALSPGITAARKSPDTARKRWPGTGVFAWRHIRPARESAGCATSTILPLAAAGNHGPCATDRLRQPGEPDPGSRQRARTRTRRASGAGRVPAVCWPSCSPKTHCWPSPARRWGSASRRCERALVWSLSTESNAVLLPMAIDSRVLAFTAAVTTLTCLVFGAIPALRAAGLQPLSALRAGGRG